MSHGYVLKSEYPNHSQRRRTRQEAQIQATDLVDCPTVSGPNLASLEDAEILIDLYEENVVWMHNVVHLPTCDAAFGVLHWSKPVLATHGCRLFLLSYVRQFITTS
ncbi:hypothetical protein CLAIMM_08748 [Cladophialophora immunda]|nr:hypothetical protein CLAIMM_08748 [Cladophialophora immunda]